MSLPRTLPPSVFALLAGVLLLSSAAWIAASAAPAGGGCPRPAHHCDHYRTGPAHAFVEAILGQAWEGNLPIQARPGERGVLVVNVSAAEEGARYDVLLAVNETEGIRWEGDTRRAFGQSSADGPREETFRFQVAADARPGPLVLGLLIRAGNETAHHEVPLEVVAPSAAPPAGRHDVPLQVDPRCPSDPGACTGSSTLRFASLAILLQATEGLRAPALQVAPGENGTLWLRVEPEGSPFQDLDVSIQLGETPALDWERTLARAYVRPPAEGSGGSPAAPHEEALPYRVPQDAPEGRMRVPFNVTVGNQTLHAAFLLDVVAARAEPGSAAGGAPGAQGSTPAPGLVLGALALAAGLVLGIGYLRRRRGGA